MIMKLRKPFVAVLGAGQVGAATAQRLLEKGMADVLLFDVVEGLPQGKALDLMQAAPIEGHDRRIVGTNNYADIAGAEIVVVAAGLARTPGMSREDLLVINSKIISEISLNIKKFSPDSKVIVATNPLDVMTYLLYKTTGFQSNRVVGMAGVLDSARMRLFLADQMNEIPRDVEAVVLGGHGDLMVPILSEIKLKGSPAKDKIKSEMLTSIVQRTKDGGAEIVKLLKTGSAYYAPASSICQMVKGLLTKEPTQLVVSAFLQGEYGIKGIFCGVPAKVNDQGVGSIIELNLTADEKQTLQLSADRIRQGIHELIDMGLLSERKG